MSNLEILEKLSKDELLTTFNPTCIRQKSNWSKIKKEHKLDNGFFDSDVFLNDVKNASPKLDALLKKIDSLDKKDEKNHGKKFKHFIFSDLKSGGHGAKMLAAALISTGWNLGYKSKVKGAPDSKSVSLSSISSSSPSASESGYPVLNLHEGAVKIKGIEGSPNYFNISSKGGAPTKEKNYHKENDDDDDNEKSKVKWGPIQMLEDKELLKSRGYNFYLLSSVAVFDKPISVKVKKEILGKFNSRPDNIHGDLARIIIMDSGFKEGIDLFDIKYIHIFEPSVNAADQKQVIGRGTRTCGQKGLEFSPTKGWPLHVFVYDLEIPGALQSSLLGATSTFDLLMKAMNVDIRLINFGYDIERLSVLGSVDYELNQAVHNFSVDLDDDDEEDQVVFGGRHLKYGEVKERSISRDKTNRMTFQKMQSYISDNFGQYKWEDVKMENLCVEKGGQSGGAASVLNYTPSQNFIRNYFKPSAPVKGMLLSHSVGTGKCHAKDTPILMHDGSVKMVQDVQVNDFLMGDDSTPRKVLSLATGVDDMYDIIPVKGDKYTVNSEHILCLKTTKLGIFTIKSQTKPFCVRYINIKTNSITSKSFFTREEAEEFQELISKDNIIEIEVNNYLKLSNNVKKNVKGYRTGVDFQSKPITLDPYIIGYWLGDGTSREPKISGQDAVVLKYMKDFAFSNNLLFNYQKGYDYRFSSYDKHENTILKALQKYNLINNKHIPNDYKINDRSTRVQVLAGLIDSDGYHDKKGCCYEITQKNKTLSDDILFLARSLGFAAYSKKCEKSCMYKSEKKTGTYWRIHISGNGLEEIPVKILRKKQYERSINKNALVTGITVNHIGKGDYYGFTLDGNNRYLLGDFTVTHNTCSAIAAATTNFEPAGYTILWVTRTTLKNDIWKNMFGQVCNESIRSKIVNGEEIPDDPKKQMRLLSKSWRIRPMSYKQFSNLVSKQNDFYKRLVKENGEVDPLRKTLLIIDEAHKLYGGGDLSSLERPDMVALHNSLMNSYAISGEDSVRLLLMTATPITESPMELIKLMNLCKPMDQQMPHTFDAFSAQYLNEEGHFTQKGENEYLDNIAGHISYLNREKDARQFSQPIVKRVLVPIATEAQLENMAEYDKFIFKSSASENVLKLKEQVEKTNEQLKGELSEMGKERFNYLKSICDEYEEEVPMKLCKKIINKNIKELTSEIKEYIKSIKSQMDVIKTEIKKVSSEKTEGLEKIKRNIEKNPEDFEKYKGSTYFSLRTLCGKRTRTNKQFLDQLQNHPDVVRYNAEIQEHEDHIQMLKNRLNLDTKAYKAQIKQLKKSLKTPGISDLEKSMIDLTIKDHQANFRTTRKLNAKQLKTDLEQDTKAIKDITIAKKGIYKSVRKTMKNRLKEEKKDLALVKKEEKRLRKTMRKESDVKDDIANEEVKKIVGKYEKNIEEELEEAAEDAEEEMKAKAQAKKAKEEEKQKKQEASEKVKKEKQEASEKAKKEKQEAAEKAKKDKQEALEKAKKAKQAEVEREKKAKQAEVEREKKAKADKAKTEKLRAKEASDKAKTAKLREKELEKLAKKAAMDRATAEKAARKTKKRSPKK